MTEPRNITPGAEPPRDDEFHRRYYTERSEGPEWAGWWWARRGWNFPWLGVLLVLVGIGLLIQYFVPGIAAGTLVLLAIALAFLAAWLIGGSWVARVPGLLILALVVARLLDELNIYSGPGTTSLSLAAGFGLIWLIDYGRGRQSSWPVWGLAIFGLIGLVQVSGRIVGIPELGVLWPVVIILLGALLLLSARRR
jgi:hypothetical protein